MKLSTAIQNILRCPICHSKLKKENDRFTCSNFQCRTQYPVIGGVLVLINENSSIFSIDDFVNRRETTLDRKSRGKVEKIFDKVIPSIGKNLTSKKNYQTFVDSLLDKSLNPKVLVIGCGVMGSSMEVLLETENIEIIKTDVNLGHSIMLICDCHDLPFEMNSFDGVVIQAVLEHVVDPNRCAEEIHRVLNKQGIVYADTPFMQQVHMGKYDFTRFTQLGHRRLFRKFEEIESGVSCGPGMALAWAYLYFLLSFTTSPVLRKFIAVFVSFTSFFLKYFDYYLISKAGSLDSASSYYFIGQKSDLALSDKELIKLYKGAL